MKISALKKQALQSLKGNWSTVIQLMIIVFLLSAILPLFIEILFSGGFSQWWAKDTMPLGVELLNWIVSLALIPLTIATSWFFLDLVRRNRTGINEAFSVYSNARLSGKLIITSILQGLFIFLWSLLLLIPGIIKSLAYSQTYFIMRDNPQLSALEAITESRKRMKGYKWKYFLMNLSFLGWGILSVITLGIGFLWLVPYVGTTTAAFYNEWIATQDRDIPIEV